MINSTSIVIYLDTKGMITDCNDLMLEETKLKKEQIINKYYLDIVKQTPKEKSFKQGWPKISKGESVQYTNREQTENEVIISTESFIPVLDSNEKVYKIIHIETKTDFKI